MAAPAENLPGDKIGRSFSTAFRGFDPAEVRAYLAQLHQEMDSLRDEVGQLRERAAGTSVLDEGKAAELLGEEAARLLTTAREGAAQIRAKAEENVERMLHEAQDDAARTRADADIEVARRLNEASEHAASQIEEAKRQGRDIVYESQALRTKMLEDVARRRKTARAQLEALRAGRDELLGALDRAQEALAKVADELRSAAPELLEPPDPAAEAGAVLADIEAGVPPSVPSDGAGAAGIPGGPSVAPGVERTGLSLVLPVVGETADAPRRVPHRIDVSSLLEAPADDDTAMDDASTAEPEAVGQARIEEVTPAGDDDAAAERPSTDDLFARIRADRERAVVKARSVLAADDIAEGEPVRPAPSGTAATFLDDRSAALGPLEKTLAHALKRALADEQNDALDRLRRSAASTVEALVGTRAEQLDRFVDVAREPLQAALAAGLQSADPEADASAMSTRAIDDVMAAVATDLAEPLRERLERAVSDADGASDEVATLLRAAYREWKVQRIDAIATELILAAHGRGTFAGLPTGTSVRWIVDPAGPACPDADDNALAGDVPCGEAFPTGHTHAPAHPGCRCGLTRA